MCSYRPSKSRSVTREGLLIAVAGQGQAADEDVEAGRDGRVEGVIGEVGFVHDVADLFQDRVAGQVEVQQRGFEGAAAVVVAQLGTPRMSKAVASAGTSAGSSTNTNSAPGSTKRRISQAQAARSTWTRALVAHFMSMPGR